MTTTPLDPRSRVLDAAKDAVAARLQADVDLLVAAAEWAVLHPATEATGYAGYGDGSLFGEDLVPLAGDGAPLVAEFAPAELAAVLGWSTETVTQLMADALELHHRLPRVWADVVALRIPVPLARYLAEQTHDLDLDLARRADRMLAGGGKLTRRILKRVVDEIRLHDDPDRAVADERERARGPQGRGPSRHHPGHHRGQHEPGHSADAEAFDATVCDLAESLKRLGDTDDLDVRRARAVGIMADPQAALNLLTKSQPPGSARTRKTGATLYLHLDLATLADLAVSGVIGSVYDERWGTATTDLAKTWLTDWLGPDAKITVKPYLDLDHPDTIAPVDGHDPTAAMIDFVRLRDPFCVFPGCTKPSRKLRPRPHRRLRPTRRRRTTRPNPPRQPRPPEAVARIARLPDRCRGLWEKWAWL